MAGNSQPTTRRLTSHVSVDAEPSIPIHSDMSDSSYPWQDPQRYMSGIISRSFDDSNPEDMKDMIRKYYDRFPSDIKIGYYDVMILYAEDDRDLAEQYREHLQNDIELEGGRRVTAVLYDDQEMVSLAGSKLKSLEYGFQRCTFAFIYLTKKFCQCEWSTLSSEECLMESIYNREKKWCVVPVYTVARAKADFKIPMGLNALKGVNFYNNDDFYRRGLRRLIGDKVMVRLQKNQEHFRRQYRHACQIRNEDVVRRKTEEDLKRYEEEKHRFLQQEMESKRAKENIRPSAEYAFSGQKERMTDSMVVEKQSQRLHEFQKYPSHHKKAPVESGTEDFGSEVKPTDRNIPFIEKSKYVSSGKTPVMHDHNPAKNDQKLKVEGLDESALLDVDYSSGGHLVPKPETVQIVEESHGLKKLHVHHYHHYPEGPAQVVKNYNIVGSENVAIGENATIITPTGGGDVLDKEEEKGTDNSLRSVSVDGGPSRPCESLSDDSTQPYSHPQSSEAQSKSASPQSPENSPENTQLLKETPLKNPSEKTQFITDKPQKTPPLGAGSDQSKDNSEGRKGFSGGISPVRANPQPRSSVLPSAKPIRPFDKPKPVMVAAVSPMPSVSKPSTEQFDDTELKTPYRDTGSTEVKRTHQTDSNSAVSDDENTDLKQVIPNQKISSSPEPSSGETTVKQVQTVPHITPVKAVLVGNGVEMRRIKPENIVRANPPVTPQVCVKPSACDSSDVDEDGPSSVPGSGRCSDEFVTVEKKDVEWCQDTKSMGTDVDSGFVLTQVERNSECVKQALRMGYSENDIKRALIKLRTKGKYDINLLLDEMARMNESASPKQDVDKSKISRKPQSAESKPNDTRQKTGILQRFFNWQPKGGN